MPQTSITREAARDIKLSGPSYGTGRDVLKHSLWDVRNFGTSANNATLFNQAIGSAFGGGSKTKNETNMEAGGRLPASQTFLVKKMAIFCQSVLKPADINGADIAQAFINILQSSYFNFRIAGREFDLQVSGAQFLPALHLFGLNSATATEGVSTTAAGFTVANGCFDLRSNPISIDELVQFQVDHVVENAVTAVTTELDAAFTLLNGLNSTLRVALVGTLTRGK